MKRSSTTGLVIAFVIAWSMSGCGDPGPDNTPAAIVLAPSAPTVQSGQSVQLAATVNNAGGQPVTGATVAYTTANSAVALVSTTGLVTGAQAGSASITATVGSVSSSVTVTVTPGAPATATKTTDIASAPVAGASYPVAIRVADASNNSVPGITVTFAVSGGGGSVSPATVTTDASGIAATTLKVGDIVGLNSVSAAITGITSSVSFTATSVAGAAAAVVKLGSAPASVIAGDSYGSEVRVRVQDSFGNAKSGATVNFSVTAGGGSVAPASVVTGANGEAAAVYTTGKIVALNTTTAAVQGVTAPASFSITTIAGPMATVSFPARVLIVAAGSTAGIGAVGKDINGNTTTAGTLTYTSRTTASATVSSSGMISGVAAGQSMMVVSATSSSDSMLAVVRTGDGPVLLTDLGSFALAAQTDISVNIVMDMTASVEKLGSTSVKLEWEPAVLTYQSHVAVAGGPAPIVNSTATSTGSLLFSLADATGYSGKVQMLKVTLRPATAGMTGSLKLTASEHTAAGTFVNLLPKTTVVVMPVIIR